MNRSDNNHKQHPLYAVAHAQHLCTLRLHATANTVHNLHEKKERKRRKKYGKIEGK